MSLLEREAPAGAKGHDKLRKLIETAQKESPIRVAVAHPCDETSLESVAKAARLGLIEPILVGPEQRILKTAAQHRIDVSALEIVDAPYSQAAAAEAVELVKAGRGEALMKGSLQAPGIRIDPIVRSGGYLPRNRRACCFARRRIPCPTASRL